MFQLSDYAYDLPEELIADHPIAGRDGSRMLALDREDGRISHRHFRDLESLLRPGDLLVVNDTRVIPARVFGTKETGGKVEILILDYLAGCQSLEETGCFSCPCLVRASKRPKKGMRIAITESVTAVVEDFGKGGEVLLRFLSDAPMPDALLAAGELPLPPYIQRESGAEETDAETYQTVYATHRGAVAAPTAGLHFSDRLMEKLAARGVEMARLTLHVGYGTFAPVRVEDIRTHQMHSERFVISEETADAVNRAKAEGRRVVAVGTTSVRTLEYAAKEDGIIRPGSGNCDLFIYPGFLFRAVDAIITNFHLPETTLMMLVAAFCGYDAVMNAYAAAIAKEYRFFSYGDAMFIG